MAVDTSKLNPPQRAAVIHGGGPLLVLAGAGSGKTRVITFRIAHLLDLGIPPDAIAALTFTNKAAEEMRERIAHLLGDRKTANKLTMGTFHSLGLQVLRSERKALGYPGGFTVYDASDQLGVIRAALREVKDFSRDGERRFDVKAILTRISLAKNSFIEPEAYQVREGDDYDAITAEVYPRYQAALRAYAAFDFDDLIVEPVRLMQRDAAVRDRWQGRFRFVLVDEYQDTNRAQVNLVRQLVARHHNLTVVGDDDQSIYAWRGADPANILGFADAFEGATVIKLEQNYRSTKTILDAANAVIGHNSDRHGKTLWSEHGPGELLTHAVAPDVETESKWVVQEIRKLKEAGRKWQDIAILYRSNIQAKPLEDELRQLSVPYAMFGGQEFFERKEVKDVIAYLRVALNPRDELSLRRIVNYPARGIGPTTLERILAAARMQHATLIDALRAIGGAADRPMPGDPAEASLDPAVPDDDDDDDPYERARLRRAAAEARGDDADEPLRSAVAVPATAASTFRGDGDLRPGARASVAGLIELLDRLAAGLAGGQPVEATKQLIEDIGLYHDLREAAPSGSAAQRRIDNVESLLTSLGKFAAKSPGPKALAEYLRKLSLESNDEAEQTGDRVIMTTLHGAKGLEFPIVFLVGLEEELLPHARTLAPQATDALDADHASDVSEERRLAYVGITRAQRKLYLTRACQRISRGREMQRTPSRFLLEIPDELLEVKDLAELAREAVPQTEVRSFFASFLADE
ncbi:MAG: UvrD-helicase domain-containing protein [Myxococcales bacterium]|nr:UvrD-helicase domain-containing protein [Myxococcales bacterium]